MKLHAGYVTVLLLSVSADPHFTRSDTFNGAILVIQHFGCSETGIDFNPEPLGLLGQPATHIGHRNDVVAFIVSGFRNSEVGQLYCGVCARVKKESISGYRCVEGRPSVFPVGK